MGRVNTALQTPLNMEGLPALSGGVDMSGLMGSAGQGIQSSFDKGRQLQYGFDPGGRLQMGVGGDQSLGRMIAADATYQQMASRLDPRFQQDQQRLEGQLSAQGFRRDSEGWKRAMDDFGRGKTDAYQQAMLGSIREGEAAAQGQFGRQLAQGQFRNQAVGQQYGQNQGQAAFWNQTAGQDYGQNLGAAQFGNSAQQQAFGQQLQATQAMMQNQQFGNQARNQGMQERAYIQNQPINQLTGLLSLGQVGTPQGIQYTPSQIANTDVLGANALATQANMARYQAQQQNRSGLMGGLFSLGSAAIMGSDRRLKTDIRLLRRRRDGLGIYAYRYKGEATPRIGVMADEVKRVRPDLVVRRADGFLAVNYAGLDLEAA